MHKARNEIKFHVVSTYLDTLSSGSQISKVLIPYFLFGIKFFTYIPKSNSPHKKSLSFHRNDQHLQPIIHHIIKIHVPNEIQRGKKKKKKTLILKLRYVQPHRSWFELQIHSQQTERTSFHFTE